MFVLKSIPAALPEVAPKDLATISSITKSNGAEVHVLRDKDGLGLICRHWCETPTSEWQVSWSHAALPGLVYTAPYNGAMMPLPGGRMASPSSRMYVKLLDAFGLADRAAMESELAKWPAIRKIEPLTHARGLCSITGNVPTHMVTVATCWNEDADATFLVADGEHMHDRAQLLQTLVALEV